MIQIKKTILTLVALLAVTTGAWAQDTYKIDAVYTFTTSGQSQSQDLSIDDAASLPFTKKLSELDPFSSFWVENNYDATYISVSGDNIEKGTDANWDTEITINGAGTAVVSYAIQIPGYIDVGSATITLTVTKNEAPAGPEVAWNKATKTGTFTMPGGNVTLEPEYYPQAALTAQPTAINDVPATTDGAIVKAGTVANIGSTTTAQGTVMYYVSPTALDDDALLALAADQWTADVPTAAHLAEGQAYVYYYVRGNDSDNDEENFSDGDILAANALTVTIAAEPIYAVTFAEGTADADKWTADPAADVKKGQTVTVTYSGSKKVLGVKAEKKAAAPATPAESTVTWNSENISFLQLYEPSAPFTMMGIKLSTSSMSNTADWRNIGIPTNDGLYFEVTTTGGYTFTAPSGKKFTKIEMTVTNANGWTQALFQNTLGTGWPSGEDAVSVVEDTKKVTWTGTAASTVGLLTDASYFNASPVTSIVFTLADAE